MQNSVNTAKSLPLQAKQIKTKIKHKISILKTQTKPDSKIIANKPVQCPIIAKKRASSIDDWAL